MDSIYELAAKLLDEHGENWDEAIEEAVQIAIDNPEIFEKFTRPLIVRSIKDIVRSVGALRRSKILNSVPTCPKGISGETFQKNPVANLEARAETMDTVLDMWLNKRKKNLRNANKEDLAVEINMFNNHARWNDQRRLLLTELYNGLKNDETVGDKFTVKQAEQIWRRVRKFIDSKRNRLEVPEENIAISA